MKKETVEEVAERFYPTPNPYIMGIDIGNTIKREAFIQGVKWQQEQDREMEKERIIDAYDEGNSNGFIIKCGEQYYNETYKNKTK